MRVLILSFALLFACAEAPAPPTVVVYGDSLSAGDGSNLHDPRLWPTKLERALDGDGQDWTVINRSINGNGLVWKTRCFGEPAADRLQSDLALIGGEATIVLMAGVNDMIQPHLPAGFSECFDPADWSSAQLIERLDAMRAANGGRALFLATIPPFSGSEFHSAKAEAMREETNRWIRSHWPEGRVVDLDLALGDPSDRSKLRETYDSGDGLHPNEAGSAAIAAAVARALR